MTQNFRPDWLSSPSVRKVAGAFAEEGVALWFVGGCVRNSLIGGAATDIDAASDARPEAVIEIAKRAGLKAIPTGIEHGTVTVIAAGEPIEITTFRKDVETDGRRAVVAYSTEMAEDAQRRDFTMNALYLSPEGVLVDPCGTGREDLMAGRVRFIGAPEARISEDYLRILRYFRFFAWYGSAEDGVDPEALSAIAELQDGLAGISAERIGAEMRKLLAAPNPVPAVAAMAQCGVLARLLPGAGIGLLGPYVHLEAEAGLAPDMMARLVALGGEGLDDRLRLSRAEQKARRILVEGLERPELGSEETGYRYGSSVGMRIEVLRRATTGRPLDPTAFPAIAKGSNHQFPLKAADLPAELEGAAIGGALRRGEAMWIESGFVLDNQALLSRLFGGQ